MYNPNTKFPVYDIDEWWADDWDAGIYAQEINWQNSFFSQLSTLFNRVPHAARWVIQCENSDYSNQINESRNCYLIFGGLNDENCDYGHIVWNCTDSMDNLYIFKSESCYECIDVLNCNKIVYSQECEGCAESVGLYDCKGCVNCIGCVGLVNKSFCIFNKQKTKEEYAKFIEENPLSDPKVIKKIVEEKEKLRTSLPQRAFFGFRNNDVSGNHIYNAHNIHYSFDVKRGENSKFCFTVREAMDSYDISFTGNASESYNCLTLVDSARTIASHNITDSHDIFYSDSCFGCNNIFGCYGLRKKSYCILNKQYTKEEYGKLVPELIELMKQHNEWGKFFPKELSPFGYNEAIVNEYSPLSKEDALKEGWGWQDDIPSTSGQETKKHTELPTDPRNYSNDLLKDILACEKCGKNYRLINRELGFYKKHSLQIPTKCFNCRHTRRMTARNPRLLWDTTCAKCDAEIKTSYTPELQKIYTLYCEKCYQQEIY